MTKTQFVNPRSATINQQTIILDLLENNILAHPDVVDCRIIEHYKNNEKVLVAYIVTQIPFSEIKIKPYLKQHFPSHAQVNDYVGISNMPLTTKGNIDEEALQQLPILNKALLKHWDQQLHSLPALSQSAIIAHEPLDSNPPLHLSKLLPDWRAEKIIEDIDDEALIEGLKSEALAYSDGGSLIIANDAPKTLTQALIETAKQYPDKGIVFIESFSTDKFLSYADLLSEAKKIKTGLEQAGLKPNDAVILQFEHARQHLPVFWGCLLAGITPLTVTIAPTYSEKNGILDKLYNAWTLLEQPLLLIDDDLTLNFAEFKTLYQIDNLTLSPFSTLLNFAESTTIHQSQSNDIAFLQLSSGSTGIAKCIPESHKAVVHHVHSVQQVNDYSSENTTLNWLALDHVGSIMHHVRDTYIGLKQIHLVTQLVLNCPECWLEYMEQFKVTHSYAPNFGYKRLNDWLEKNPTLQWDLSSVKQLINAGEQVTYSVIEKFIKLTQKFNLSKYAMQPAYGMAETATGVVYCKHYNANKHAHHIEKSSLQGHLIFREHQKSSTITFIEQGLPNPGIKFRIVDDLSKTLPENVIGQLQVTGDTVMPGYLNNEQANKEAFSQDGWYNSGDLGFITGGRLVLTGREKEIIVIYGMNYYCVDIESLVSAIIGVIPGYVAACGVSKESTGTEELVIFFVPKRLELRRNIELLDKIQTQVTLLLGVNPSHVIPITKNDFPKTTSGKIQRSKLKNLLAAGFFEEILNDCDCILNNKYTQPDWSYKNIWRLRKPSIIHADYPKGPYLIFLDTQNLGQRVYQEISMVQRCIRVEVGKTYQQIGIDHFRLDPENTEHYQLLFAHLTANQIIATKVLHFWNYTTYDPIDSLNTLKQRQKWSLSNFLLLAQNLIKAHDIEHPVQFSIISTHTRPVLADDNIAFEKGSMLGLIRTMPHEAPWVSCRHIDLPIADNETNSRLILNEISSPLIDKEVAYRNNKRYIQRLQKIIFTAPEENNIPIKKGAMYLISGGLSGIGIEISAYLLQHYQIKLIIIGKTDLQQPSTELTQKKPHKQKQSLQFLQEFAGEIIYHAVDVCDEKRLKQIVSEAEQQWNSELEGIFHLSGAFYERLLREESRQTMAQILVPKVMGAWVLHQLIKDKKNKLFIHFSSSNSIIGSKKQGAYTAASCFLNNFSNFQNISTEVNSFCFAWSTWLDANAKHQTPMQISDTPGFHSITANQGINALMIGLQHKEKFLIIGLDSTKHNITQKMEQACISNETITAYYSSDNPRHAFQQLQSLIIYDAYQNQAHSAHIRLNKMPLLNNGQINKQALLRLKGFVEDKDESRRIPPNTKTERILCSLWQDILDTNEPGINDSFFKLGGSSLLASILVSRIRDIFDINIRLDEIFRTPTIAQLSSHIDMNKGVTQHIIKIPKLHQNTAPLSFAQERLWFIYQLDENNPLYNTPISIEIEGPLDVNLLTKCINIIVDRHDSLRTRFLYHDQYAIQKIEPTLALPIKLIDLTDIDNKYEQWPLLSQKETGQAFDLTELPLLRLSLYKLTASQHILFIVIHHIIADGWSINIIQQELITLYEALAEKQSLPELPIQYIDFSTWQHQWLKGDKLNQQLAYWKNQLNDITPLDLPTDFPRKDALNIVAARHRIHLPIAHTSSLNTLCQKRSISLFMVLISTLMMLFKKYTGLHDIAIGIPVANRHIRELEPLIGFFVNTLVIRGDLAKNITYNALLTQIKKTTLEAIHHQDLPFEKLVEALQPERMIGKNPLCQVVLAMQNAPTIKKDKKKVTFKPHTYESGSVHLDLEIHVFETEQGLAFYFDYNAKLFKAETIERMANHYITLLKSVSDNPTHAVHDYSILSKTEQTLMMDWNNTAKNYPVNQCIHHLFENQVQKTPQAHAVNYENQTITYAALNERANQLANYLLTQIHQPETFIGISIARSIDMIVCILAVFKSGCAYVPLDPAYPQERLNFIIDDTKLPVILTQQSITNNLPKTTAQMICIDSEWPLIGKQAKENPNIALTSNHLAYTIYTSGSTGKPKGVLIEHKGVNNLAFSQIDIFKISPNDRILQFSSLNFDASISEILMTLLSGATLIIPHQNTLLFGKPLIKFIDKFRISVATIPPSILTTLQNDKDKNLPSLTTLIVAGENCPQNQVAIWEKDRHFFNAYGPTETTVCATAYQYSTQGLLPIGKPIPNTKIYILDNQLNQTPIGITGEIYIAGIGVARGYLNRHQLTTERFIANPFCQGSDDDRLYKTGDLGYYLNDGNIEYIGREDNQIKIRGFRVEIGEIENRLKEQSLVKEAIIYVNQSNPQNPLLLAYIIPQKTISNNKKILFEKQIKTKLKQQLPSHMIPSAFTFIDEIPLTHNGKLDFQALPEIIPIKAKKNRKHANNQIEQDISHIIEKILSTSKISTNSHFFDDLGGNSLQMVQIHRQIELELKLPIALVDLFEYPTVRLLAKYLNNNEIDKAPETLENKKHDSLHKQAVAIIGMAGRFPGANNTTEFWQKIKQGEELIQHFSEQELLDAGVSPTLLNNPHYVKAKGVLQGVEEFDAEFFKFNPNEARFTDPQQRLFLESAWQAFEDAGYDPTVYPGKVGIFGGAGSVGTYFTKNLLNNPQLEEIVGEYQLGLSNSPDFLCTRVAYKLNLKGIAATMQTACSTSLVPIVMGYNALTNHEVDLILAGGSAISLPIKNGYLYQDGMILSPDGHCRTFDAKAKGTVASNAVGTVILKRLDDAIRDHDHIYAVIKGAAFNNDGNQKVGFTASGLEGQIRVIKEALIDANVSPSTIDYVEAHGTATPLGDPIEIRALTKAWQSQTELNKKAYCAIGSVKTNLGHCDAAAGITGLIKTVSALKHKQIPPSLHFTRPNKEIDFANSPFYVNNRLSDWQHGDSPRRAAVSSFGMGGTNAHVILEEAPEREPSSASRAWQILFLSAKNEAALTQSHINLAHHIKNNLDQPLSDIAYTTQVGRQAMPLRNVITCQSSKDAIEQLEEITSESSFVSILSDDTPRIVFMFPGQGAQYLNMAKDCYRHESLFKEIVDECLAYLKTEFSLPLYPLIFPTENRDNEAQLNQTQYAQPALFIIEYALAKLIMSWGIQPDIMIGHSLGEYTAACLAEVFTLQEALKLVTLRGQLMQSMTPGKMLAVPLSEQDIQPWLSNEIELAAVNSPNRCVLAGASSTIISLQKRMQDVSINSRLLITSHAYHTSMMEPAIKQFMETLETINFNRPTIEIISTMSGDIANADNIIEPSYWGQQIRQTVRFSDAISTALKIPNTLFLEIGPGNTLSTLTKAYQLDDSLFRVINTLPRAKSTVADFGYLLNAVGQLWQTGVEIHWPTFYQDEIRYRLPLPTYPFQKKRYWIDANLPSVAQHSQTIKDKTIKNWFYRSIWQQYNHQQNKLELFKNKSCLIIKDGDCQLAGRLINKIKTITKSLITISNNQQFKIIGSNFCFDLQNKLHYERCFEQLYKQSQLPEIIIHCTGINENEALDTTQLEANHLSYFSLIFLMQAISEYQSNQSINLTVLTNQLQKVTDKEIINPKKSTILGPCVVIPQEYPMVNCQNIDLELSDFKTTDDNHLKNLLSIIGENQSKLLAYRNSKYWLQKIEAVQFSESSKKNRIKREGMYLITGGLGGIAIELACYLGNHFDAKLILTTRSNFPEFNQWDSILDHADKSDPIIIIINKLKTIHDYQSKITIITANVSDLSQMRMITTKYEHINGIIHTAGVSGNTIIQNQSIKNSLNTFDSKVEGTLVLDQLNNSKSLDFIVLFSSLSTIFGGLGYVDYCSANIFMDKYALSKSKKSDPIIISIGWDGWTETGMATKIKRKQAMGLTTNQGIQCFIQALASSLLQVYVTKQDLPALLKKHTLTKQPKSFTKLNHNLSQLTNTLKIIWEKCLGIDKIIIDDDFFELGGDSLLAVQLIALTNEKLGLEIPYHVLMNTPTIKGMAQSIKKIQNTNQKDKISPLLIKLKSGSSKQSLILLHPVGGSVFMYRDFAEKLDDKMNVYAIQAQGLDGKKSLLTSIEEMASYYCDIIKKLQPKGPYLLAGASLGGILAYEIAQQLQISKNTIGLLAMIDTPGPGNMPSKTLDTDLEILHYLLNIAINSTIDIKQLSQYSIEQQLQLFIETQNKQKKQLVPDVSTLKHFLNIFKSNAKAMKKYKPREYQGKIQFFVAQEKDDYNAHFPHHAWQPLASGGIDVTIVSGNHVSMTESPNVSIIAKKIMLTINAL